MILLIFVLSSVGCFLYHFQDKLLPVEVSSAQHVVQIKKKSNTLVALESYISQTNPLLPNKEVAQYAILIDKYASQNKIDPYLLAGLMRVESRFDRYAVSDAGALGLTQVVPKWHREKIKALKSSFGHFDIFEPEHNVALGSMILAEYMIKSKTKIGSLLRYNGSLGMKKATYAKEVLAAREIAWGFRRRLT